MISPLNKTLLALAIPSIIANITTPLMGLVDTAVTGHLGSQVYIAAIAIGSSLFNFLYWPMGFLRMGSSGMTAQAVGKEDREEQADILYRGLLVALVISIVVISLQQPLFDLLISFIGADMATARCVADYFSIVIWGSPAVLSTYVMTGWLLGRQSAKKPMLISIVINVVNICISPTLAFVFDLDIMGVAFGTLSAQWIGAVVGLIICLREHPGRCGTNILNVAAFAGFARVNFDVFVRTLCLMAVSLWFTREGARQGELTLAANALLMQFFILFSYFIDGFAYAAEALVGKMIGSGNNPELKRCIRLLMKWGFGLALFFSCVYFICGEVFLRWLTDRKGVIVAAVDYLPWIWTVPFAGFMAFTWDGIYIGALRTRTMLLSMAVSVAIFFGTYYIFQGTIGNHALWFAFTLYLFARGLLQSYFWRRR